MEEVEEELAESKLVLSSGLVLDTEVRAWSNFIVNTEVVLGELRTLWIKVEISTNHIVWAHQVCELRFNEVVVQVNVELQLCVFVGEVETSFNCWVLGSWNSVGLCVEQERESSYVSICLHILSQY